MVSKHNLPNLAATDKGHLARTRKGTRSTRSMRQALLDARENVDDMDPTEYVCSALEDQMFCFAMLADSIEGPYTATPLVDSWYNHTQVKTTSL